MKRGSGRGSVRGIGEEVIPPPEMGAGPFEVIARFGPASSLIDLIWNRIRLLLLVMAAINVPIILLGFVLWIVEEDLLFLICLPTAFGTLFIAITVPIMVMLLPIFRMLKKDMHVDLTREFILVSHRFWFNYPRIDNRIPYDRIDHIEPAGPEYHKQRRRAVPFLQRMNMMGAPPPPGGLYSPFFRKRGLLVLFLDSPVMVGNYSMPTTSMLIMHASESRYVKEIVLDIDHRRHDEFIDLVMRKVKEARKDRFRPVGGRPRTAPNPSDAVPGDVHRTV